MALEYDGTMRLKIGTKTVLHEVKTSFSMSSEFEELASKDITGKELNPGDISWTMQVDAIADNSAADAQMDVKSIAALALSQASVEIALADAETGNLNISGDARISDFNLDSENKKKVSFSYTLKGERLPTFAETSS